MNVKLIKKIAYCVTSLVLVAAVLLQVLVVPVRAAEISSLPADVGVEVTYDSGNVYLTYEGETFTISRSTLLNSSAPTEYSYPVSWAKTCEVDHYGYWIPCSYWFSPSDKCVYIMTSNRFAGNSQYTWMYGTDYCYTIQSYSSGSFYMTASYVHSSNKKRIVGYKLNLSDMSVSLYGNVYDKDGSSVITSTGYPEDLVCIFSNYEISGFWESTVADTCYTPDYYFNYQYLFYTEDVGYTFVDSAKPLVSITNPDPTQALLTFSEICNKHVYTSVDGIDWTEQYSVSGMYSTNASVAYKWFYDSAGGTTVYKLVYANDESFGEEPIIKPTWNEIEDISDLLKNYSFDEIYEEYIHESSIEIGGDDYTIASILGNLFTGNASGTIDAINQLIYGDGVSVDDFAVDYYFALSSLLSEFISDNASLSYIDDDGFLHEITQTSIRTYIKSLVNNMDDLIVELDLLTNVVHNDLKSVFDNISNTNLYLEKLNEAVKDIDIPDYNYFDKLNELIRLSASEIDVVIGIKQVLFDIQSALESDSDSSSGSVSFDDSAILEQLYDINLDLDSLKGTPDIDSMLDFFDDLDSDNDWDYDEIPDFIDMVISGLSGEAAAGDIAVPVLEDTLSFDSEVVSGAAFLNTIVMKFWDVMGPLQTVTLLGASFFVMHMVIRKGMF